METLWWVLLDCVKFLEIALWRHRKIEFQKFSFFSKTFWEKSISSFSSHPILLIYRAYFRFMGPLPFLFRWRGPKNGWGSQLKTYFVVRVPKFWDSVHTFAMSGLRLQFNHYYPLGGLKVEGLQGKEVQYESKHQSSLMSWPKCSNIFWDPWWILGTLTMK